ncbi:MAG TPA: S1C family serine protease, partial [Dongiaceae bacterium]|nr:S1C family serine protease [Dongiaceae bacterium]
MPTPGEQRVPPAAQPKPENYRFDLNRALSSVVGVRASIPDDAFTAETLGTERGGNGVLISEKGVVLTIGYLIVEAEQVWLQFGDGRAVPGHVLGYDQETGFGLVQALGAVGLPALGLGNSAAADVGERVVLAGAGGRPHAVAARIAVKQEFAGYWEYAIDEAIFTSPAHPSWGGAALIGPEGDLLGIGSLQLQREGEGGRVEDLNMIVPIDLLKPVLDDLLTLGRPNRPPRPWLGIYATEVEDKVVVAGVAGGGPAQQAKLKTGDIVLAVGGGEVGDLADLYRRV